MFKPYSYVKKTKYSASSETGYIHEVSKKILKKPSINVGFNIAGYLQTVAIKTVVSSALIITGIYMMVTQVFIPVVDTYANSGDVAPIISPIAENSNSSLSLRDDEPFEFKELNASFREVGDDEPEQVPGEIFGEANTQETKDSDEAEPEYFYLTVPALEIQDAKVEINSTNLDPKKAIGHYKGTCLPDEACNSFIFGHSTYKNAKNRYKQEDYSAIFAHLDELKYGDEFTVKYKNHEYKYVVELTRVERPENIDPLAQPLPRSIGKHESTMELFTCTPSGTTKYRLSVVGRLVNTSEI